MRDVAANPATIATHTPSAAAARAGGERRKATNANAPPAATSATTASSGIAPKDALVESRASIGSPDASLAVRLRPFNVAVTARMSQSHGSKMKTASPKYHVLSTG